jgi:hypothetical protein
MVEKRFKILRIIGTIWKVLAWIALAGGVLAAIGTLVGSIFGGGVLGQLGQQYGFAPGASQTFGLVGGIAGFVGLLIMSVVYFLILYAVGEVIYLMLSIEENTRLTSQWVQARPTPQAPAPAPPVYHTPTPTPPPPPPPMTPTPPPTAPMGR